MTFRKDIPLLLLLITILMIMTACPSPEYNAAMRRQPVDPPPVYVGASEIFNEFDSVVTTEMIEEIKRKKVLIVGNSYARDLARGTFEQLYPGAVHNDVYNPHDSDPADSEIPEDLFELPGIITFLCHPYPAMEQIKEFKSFFSYETYFYDESSSSVLDVNYTSEVDVALLIVHSRFLTEPDTDITENGYQNIFDYYSTTMRVLREENPHIIFVILTQYVDSPTDADPNASEVLKEKNLGAHNLNPLILQEYKNKMPLLDLGEILATYPLDGTPTTHVYDSTTCDVIAPDHANSDKLAQRISMGKGLLLLLAKLYQ